MKVLVTGGTGFIGREVLRQLGTTPNTVSFLARRPLSPGVRALAESTGAKPVPGDVLDRGTLNPAVEEADAVIHLVGIISEARKLTFERLHVEATRNVVDACMNAKVSRYLHMSALGTRPNGPSRYHQTKWAAEECVRQSGLNALIFRPSLVYGPEDHFVNLFARMMKYSPLIPVIGDGAALMAPISVASVARAFIGALSEPIYKPTAAFDLCGKEQLTLPEILSTIMRVTGRRRRIIRIPLPLARAQAAILEWVCGRIFGFPPPLNRDQIIMLQEDNVGDSETAKRLFALEEPTFERGIRKYLGAQKG